MVKIAKTCIFHESHLNLMHLKNRCGMLPNSLTKNAHNFILNIFSQKAFSQLTTSICIIFSKEALLGGKIFFLSTNIQSKTFKFKV